MFDILMDNNVSGSAEISKEGLYYRFTCVCTVPLTGIHRIYVSDGEGSTDLGICVPTGDRFTLVRRLPIKRFSSNTFTFTLSPDNKKNTAIPVVDGEPFTQLDQLDEANLQITDAGAEILIDSALNPQDSDQIPESPNKWEQP